MVQKILESLIPGKMLGWDSLPDLVLANIMVYLSKRDRIRCEMVCQSWSKAVENPTLWKHFHIYIDTELKGNI